MFKNRVGLGKERHAGGRSTAALMFLAVALFALPAFAGLERVGPTAVSNGYPAWYQDSTGITLEFCSVDSQAVLDGGWCLLLPGDTTAPESFPGTFADEHFYWAADSIIDLANGGRLRLILGLEAAFAQGPVIQGDQVVFGRIRFDFRGLQPNSTYTVYHPFGTWDAESDENGDVNFTEDIGIACPPGNFECALSSNLGPFLLPSNTPGGAELPPTLGPGGKLYIASPDYNGPVTGSLFGQNFFRVVGPGVDERTDNFTLMGRLRTGAIPGNVKIDRATYSKSSTENKLDVFVTARPSIQSRLPGTARLPETAPGLGYYHGACTEDADGVLGRPAGTRVPLSNNPGIDDHYWGQSAPEAIPPAVCVEDFTSRDAAGQLVPTYFGHNVTDQIIVSEATYDPANGGSLLVKAVSSDTVTGLILTLAGHGALAQNGQITVSPLAAPPSRVQVLSEIGGVGEAEVVTLTGAGGGGGGPIGIPVAVGDDVTVVEDSAATNIPVLDNDTLDGNPVDPAATTVTITAAPRLGDAEVNPDGTIAFAPNANAAGIDSLTYVITVGGQTSAPAFVSINITAANDAPTAVNDSAAGVVGQLFALNLPANDSDPDGNADLADAVLEGTWPAELGTNPFINGVAAGGVVNIRPAAAGTFTFSYRARDAAGAVSANAAVVTITVTGTEVITVVNAEYRILARRWRVSGTSSVIANQTMTISYANGSSAGTVIGTATVDATGAWALDLRGVTGVLDPTTLTFPGNLRQIRVTSSLGASTVVTFTVRF